MIVTQSGILEESQHYTIASYRPIFSQYALEELEGDMRVSDRVLKTVVFIGRKPPGGVFVPYGTGFIVASFIGEETFQNIITAKHVINDIPGDEIHVRVNGHSGQARLLGGGREHWYPHPNPRIDVIVGASGLHPEEYDILHLRLGDDHALTPKIIKDQQIGIGDEVFVAGMFVQRLGEARNLPIVRSGIIAAMPDEKIHTTYGYHDAYLIESRSISGLSGSPVFVQTPMLRTVDGKVIPPVKTDFLMGMLLGHHQVQSSHDTVEIIQGEGDEKKSEDIPIPLNTGIGIVLPFHYVEEAIEQPALREARQMVVDEMRKGSGFKPDSAGIVESEPSTKADNPSHREDFNSLLTSVATAKKSDDET